MASKYDDDDPGYADSKYSDDGGMDSKFSAGDSSEAKGSSAGSGDVGVVLPPIVQAFAHHVMAKKFRDASEAFFAANCAPFRGVDPKGEQLLEYTEVFTQYVAMVEASLEAFCAGHHVTSEDLFAEVQGVMAQGGLDDEFLPAVLRVAEYSYFLEQMVLTANHSDNLRDAYEQAAELQELDSEPEGKDAEVRAPTVTGVWRVDKQRTNFDGLDVYLAAIRVPAVFRGLAKGTFYSNKELVVLQGPASISLISTSPFGKQQLDYRLDGQVHDVANPWGKEVPVRCSLDEFGKDGVEVVVEQITPNGLPPGSSVVHTWSSLNGGRALRCSMEVRCPNRATASFHLLYQPVRKTDLNAKAKGKSSAPAKVAGAKGLPRDDLPQSK